MRVIAGKFKKSNLVTVKGNRTRPTTDYVKEVIYSILPDCEDFKVLDLFAGSGGLGLEALSRGASYIDFVDASEKAIKVLYRNVNKLNCNDNVKIHKKKVSRFIKKCEKKFDLILIDPPYDKDLVNPTIEIIRESNILKDRSILMIEHSPEESISADWLGQIEFQKTYGQTEITLLKFTEKEEQHENL